MVPSEFLTYSVPLGHCVLSAMYSHSVPGLFSVQPWLMGCSGIGWAAMMPITRDGSRPVPPSGMHWNMPDRADMLDRMRLLMICTLPMVLPPCSFSKPARLFKPAPARAFRALKA